MVNIYIYKIYIFKSIVASARVYLFSINIV